MDNRAIAETLLKDHFTATAALIALMLKTLPDKVRTRTLDAVRNCTGKVELRTRVETSQTELVLVPSDVRTDNGWKFATVSAQVLPE